MSEEGLEHARDAHRRRRDRGDARMNALPKTMLRRGVERYGWGVGVVATLGGRIG